MMMECNAVECNGMDRWNAMHWSGMGWSGIMEWNGVEWILVEYDSFQTCWPARPAKVCVFSNKMDLSGSPFQPKTF